MIPILRNTPESSRWLDPNVLLRLDRVRKPWDALSRRIAQSTFNSYPPPDADPLVEIGAGGGQLRDWLPEHIANRTIHTEPSRPFVDVFKTRHPGARILKADAASLPVPNQSIAGLIGLCVLDAVSDLAAVRDECLRVLKPEGVVIHFLDLSTNPDACFEERIGQGEIPFPNFTQEPGLLDALPAVKRAFLPVSDPFDEVLIGDWESFVKFIMSLRRSGHPAVEKLGPYARLHEPGALDPFRLGQEFMRVRADASLLRETNIALLTVALLAADLGRPIAFTPLSLRTHFRSRLKAAFSERQGFAIQAAGPISSQEQSTEERYVLRHAGRTWTSHDRPLILGTPADFGQSSPSQRFRATTIEVFVARRLG